MYCNNCGTENEKNTKVCVKCGKEFDTNSEEANAKGEGLGTASMVIGIISLILTFILTILTLPLSITGLILGIVNKGKGGKKVSGIVLNSISIGLSFILVFVYLIIGIGILGTTLSIIFNSDEFKDEFNNLYNVNYVSGNFNCKSFDGSGEGSSYIVRLELNKDMSFMWGKYGETSRNYVKGTYTYEDLNKKDNSGKFTYYKISLDGDEFYENGIKKSDPYTSTYEFGITKQNGKKQGVMINERTYNMYYCYEE